MEDKKFNEAELRAKDKADLTKEEKSFLRKEYFKWVLSEFNKNKVLAFLLLCNFIMVIKVGVAYTQRLTPYQKEEMFVNALKEENKKAEKDNHRNKKNHTNENKPVVQVEKSDDLDDKKESVKNSSTEPEEVEPENKPENKPKDKSEPQQAEQPKPVEEKERIQEDIETVSIGFKTIERKNEDMLIGQKKVVQNGKKGSKNIKTVSTYKGDKLILKEVSEEIVSNPIDEIVEVGTKIEVVEQPFPENDDDSWEDLGFFFYKDYKTFDKCNAVIDEVLDEKAWDGEWSQSLCDSDGKMYYVPL